MLELAAGHDAAASSGTPKGGQPVDGLLSQKILAHRRQLTFVIVTDSELDDQIAKMPNNGR
jgi:hypothetical protein